MKGWKKEKKNLREEPITEHRVKFNFTLWIKLSLLCFEKSPLVCGNEWQIQP
jgi:hypothetical protein